MGSFESDLARYLDEQDQASMQADYEEEMMMPYSDWAINGEDAILIPEDMVS